MKKDPTSTPIHPSGLMEQMWNLAPTGLMVVHSDGTVGEVNELAASLFGSTVNEMTGTMITQYIPHIPISPDTDDTVDDSQKTFLGKRQDGSLFALGLKQNKVVLDGAICFITVVEHMKFTSLFELHPDAAFSLDRKGRFQRVNAAFERITGFRAEEILQTTCTSMIAPKDYDRTCEMFYRTLSGETVDCEIEVLTKTGERVDIHITSIPIIVEHTSIGIYIVAKDVTEQKQTRKALSLAQYELKETVEQQQGLIFKFKKTNDGRFIHTLAAGELLDLIQARPDKMVGHEVHHFVPEPLASYIYDYYEQAWQGKCVNYEVMAGPDMTLLATLKPIYRDGVVVEVIGSGVDISCLKKAEEELRRAKELLESFINHTTDGIMLMDCELTTLFVNRAIEKIYGWPEADFVGKGLFTIPDFLLEQELKIFDQVKAGTQISGYETLRMRKDGSVFHASVTLSPVRDALGQVVGISGIVRDISDRIHMEEKLRKSEQKYRLIAENVNDLIGLIEVDGTVRYASPSHKNVLGVDPVTLEGRHAFALLHPETAEPASRRFQELVESKIPIFTEFRQRHGSGEYLTIEADISPILDESGQVKSVLVVGRDITERKRTEELLRNSEKLSAIGQLAAGVAHEIRNPLTSLRGFIQLMQASDSNHKPYFDIMISELDRINFIVSELLFLAKPQVSLFTAHQPTALLQDVISLLDTQAIMNNVQIVTKFEADVPDLFCEDKQLKQVFINVLKNAIEAMPSGGEVHIHLTREEPDQVRVRFTDQGCGIPQERLPKLGEPFYTTKEKGTGLGLMVTYKIVRDHMGSIEFSSEVGKGTTVDVILPASKS